MTLDFQRNIAEHWQLPKRFYSVCRIVAVTVWRMINVLADLQSVNFVTAHRCLWLVHTHRRQIVASEDESLGY